MLASSWSLAGGGRVPSMPRLIASSSENGECAPSRQCSVTPRVHQSGSKRYGCLQPKPTWGLTLTRP